MIEYNISLNNTCAGLFPIRSFFSPNLKCFNTSCVFSSLSALVYKFRSLSERSDPINLSSISIKLCKTVGYAFCSSISKRITSFLSSEIPNNSAANFSIFSIINKDIMCSFIIFSSVFPEKY